MTLGKTGPGPPAIDYIILEYDIRLRFLMPIILEHQPYINCIDKLFGIFERTVDAETGAETSSLFSDLDKNEQERLQFAVESIRKIREHGLRGVYKDHERAYFLVYFLYLIRVIQRLSNRGNPLLNLIKVAYAGMMADRVYDRLKFPEVRRNNATSDEVWV